VNDEKDLEGRDQGVIDMLPQYLFGGSEENLRIASVRRISEPGPFQVAYIQD
jgi:hypothetical protein